MRFDYVGEKQIVIWEGFLGVRESEVAQWQCWCLEGKLQEGWLDWEGAVPMVWNTDMMSPGKMS